MKKNEFIEAVKGFENKMERWTIQVDYLSDADFVMGYGFDQDKNQWKVYQNNERGAKLEWYFQTEEEAIQKLFKKVKFQYKVLN